MCIQCRPLSFPLIPFTLNPRPTRIFLSETLRLFPSHSMRFFHSFLFHFLHDILPIVPPSNIVARSVRMQLQVAHVHPFTSTLLPLSFPLILLLHRYYFPSFLPPALLLLSYSSPLCLLFTDVAESSIFSPGLDSDIEAGYTHVYILYVHRALVFSVFIASYHPFFLPGLATFSRGPIDLRFSE